MLEDLLKGLEDSLARKVMRDALAQIIEAEILAQVSSKFIETGKRIHETLDDDELMAEITIDAMTTMIPKGHKYEDRREEATVEASKRILKRKEILIPVLKELQK